VMLAPDWTLANLQIAGKTIPAMKGKWQNGKWQFDDPTTARLQARYWRNMIPTLATSVVGLQWTMYQAFGDKKKGDQPFPWMNEKGRELNIDITPLYRKLGLADEKQRYYTHFGKQVYEVTHWMKDPMSVFHSKLSPAAHVALEMITGSEGAGFETPWAREPGWSSVPARAVSVGQKFVPFSFSGNQFMLTAPMRKGATPWKTRIALEKTLDRYAHPAFYKRGEPAFKAALAPLVRDILDAAELNGIDPDVAFREALSAARSKYYGKFFDALQKQESVEPWAKAILRLHGALPGLQRSLKARAERRGVTLTDRDLQRAAVGFEGAGRRMGRGEKQRAIISELTAARGE